MIFRRKVLSIVGIAFLCVSVTKTYAIMLPGNEGVEGPINHLSTTIEKREQQIFDLANSLNFPGHADIPMDEEELLKLPPEAIGHTLLNMVFENLQRQTPKEAWANIYAIYAGPNASEFVRPLSWGALKHELPHVSPSTVSRFNFENGKIILEELTNVPARSLAAKIFRLRSAYKANLYYQWIKKNGAENIREVYYSLDLLGEVGFATYVAQMSEFFQFLGYDPKLEVTEKALEDAAGMYAAKYVKDLLSQDAQTFLLERMNEAPLNKLKRADILMTQIMNKSAKIRYMSADLVCETALRRWAH